MGANCSPTERACKHANDPACTSSEYPACINFCVDHIDAATAAGKPCVLDPCNLDPIAGGSHVLCPDGFSCVADDTGSGLDPDFGTCQAIGQQPLHACNPAGTLDSQAPCATGSYCQAFKDADPAYACPDVDRPSWIGPNEGDGICRLPVREGGACDSNWGERGCLTCEPGTECVPDPSRGGATRCRRPCETDDDCPCDFGSGMTGDPDTSCYEDGYCGVCISNRNECTVRAPDPDMDELCEGCPTCKGCQDWIRNEPYACCDPKSDCLEVDQTLFEDEPLAAPGIRACCYPEGNECDADEQCCPGFGCVDGICKPCIRRGEPFEQGGECCGDLIKRDGKCLPECEMSVPDMPPGTGIKCGEACGMDLFYECTENGDECPDATSTGATEVCNGTDDDCDNRIDEDISPTSCKGAPRDGRCAGEEFDGQTECVNGQIVCDIPSDAWCGRGPTHDTAGGRVSEWTHLTNVDCGAAAGTTCCDEYDPGSGTCNNPESGCGPYETCSNVVSCANSASGTCVLCEVVECNQDMCWAPSESGSQPHSCP